MFYNFLHKMTVPRTFLLEILILYAFFTGNLDYLLWEAGVGNLRKSECCRETASFKEWSRFYTTKNTL